MIISYIPQRKLKNSPPRIEVTNQRKTREWSTRSLVSSSLKLVRNTQDKNVIHFIIPECKIDSEGYPS